MRLLFLLLLLSACGAHHKSASSDAPQPGLKDLQDKSDKYLSIVSQEQDQYGFILSQQCDSLLFTSLLAAARPGLHIEVTAAQDSSGQWYRRADHGCGPKFGNSRSTISRDMFIGLFWYFWRTKDLDGASGLMLQLQANNYQALGEGSPGELLLTPAMVQTLAELIFKLGGPDYSAERKLPAIFDGSQTDYEAHLTVWHILLRGEIFGGLSEGSIQILAAQAIRQPKNPFFQAAYHRYLDGDYSTVIKLLMDTNEWPADSLPTSLNHCDPWPIQRDFSSTDWGTCEPTQQWPGAELPVIYYLIVETPSNAA